MSTTKERIRQRFKELDEQKGKSDTSNSDNLATKDRIKKRFLENSIGMDSLRDDLNNTGLAINNIYGGWQAPETIRSTRSSVESMQKRLNDYKSYRDTYGVKDDLDIDSLLSGYNSVMENWDNIEKTYGAYKDADSFNKAKKFAQFDKDFAGLSFDDVLKTRSKYSSDSDERKYLNEYTGYSSLDDFDKALSVATGDHKRKLEEARNKYKLDNAFDSYKDYMNAEDFAEKSKYQKTAKRDGLWETFGLDGSDETYEFINDVDGARERLIAKYKNGNEATELEQHGYEYMTDDEKAVYNYLYAQDKKLADRYLKDMEISLSKRSYEDTTATWEEWTDDSVLASIGMDLATPIFSMAGGIGTGVETVKELVTGESYNPYASARMAGNAANDIRKYVGDNIEESTNLTIGGENVARFLHDTGMSIADSGLRAATFGKVGGVLAGMGAYQQTAKDLMESGASEAQTQSVAVAAGVAELVFESIGIDNLFKIKNADSLRNVIMSTLKQAGIEGLEEVGTEITNILADTIIRGGSSEMAQTYYGMIDRGYSEKEAGTEVAKTIGKQLAMSGIGGALSGGVMGGVYSGSQYNDFSNTGRKIKDNYTVDDLKGITTELNKDVYADYLSMLEGGNITDAKLGSLYSQVKADTDTENMSERVDKVYTDDSKEAIARRKREKELTKGTETMVNGENASIENVRIEDSATTLVTSRGEVSVDDAVLSANDAKMVSYAETMSPEQASAFMSNYDGKTDADTYREAFNLAYSYGQSQIGMDFATKNIKSLNISQMSEIYRAGRMEKVVARQKEIKAIQAKYTAKKFYKGKVNDSEVDYNSLTESQKENVEIMKALYTGLGMNVRLTTKGVEEGYNGVYDRDKNEIIIDVYAGIKDKDIKMKNIKDSDLAIVTTSAHELTHWMEDMAPELYAKIKDHVFATLTMEGATELDLIDTEKKRILDAHKDMKTVSNEYAISEIVARACEDMLSMTDVGKETLGRLTESERKTIFTKVKEILQDMIDYIGEILGRYKSKSKEAQMLREYQDRLKELAKLWEEGIKEAVAVNQSMTEAELSGEKAVREIGYSSMMFNLRLTDSHKENLETMYSEDADIELDTLLARYNKVIDIWKKLGGELDSKFLKAWNEKSGKDRNFTIFKKQSGYKYNVELSSMCKKGVPLFEAIDTIVKNEVMKELNVDRIGKAEKEILYDILKAHNFEIPCAICYVEQARQREGDIIDAFLNGKVMDAKKNNIKLGWNEVLSKVEAEMQKLGVEYTFQKVDRSIATDSYSSADIQMDEATQNAFYEALKTVANEEIKRYNATQNKNRPLVTKVTPSAINEVFGGKLSGNLKIFKVLFNNPDSRFTIDSDLLYSSMTTQNLAATHNALYSLFNEQGGVAGYKTKQGTEVYWGDILKKTWKALDIRKEGGVRNQSNSDFQMYTLLDQAQMYIDFSAKGYYLQAYTKVLPELKLFGLSNGKINSSFIPKVLVYKNVDGTVDMERTRLNAGLDENGNLIFDDIEGVNHAEAFMLIEDAEYSKSICGVCIGYSDNHILKMLDENRIQLVIGFHDKTNDPDKRYRGARYATNYNGYNEATKKSDGSTVHIGFNQFVKKAENKFKYNESTKAFEGSITYNGKAYVANDIPKLAADLYLEHCEKKGLNPAYSQCGIDFSKHENYYKLLADFGLYDSNGNYAPHRKVTFNMPSQVPCLDAKGNKYYEDTESYIKKELEKELKVRDSISEALSDKSKDGIIPQFVEKVNKLQPKRQYSDRDDAYIDSRTLLANALDTVAQTDSEKDLLAEYRENIDIINIKESELSEITAQIKELSFASGKRDEKKLQYLSNRAEKLRGSINYFDKKLLNMEAATPLKAVVERERKKARKIAYEKNREYTKEVMNAYKENVEKRAKIDSITQKAMVLNKWMLENSKDKHIPDAMKPVVTNLLQSIDFSSKRLLKGGEPTHKDISLAGSLEKVKDMMASGSVDGEVLYELYGHDMDAEMKQLVENVNTYMRTFGDNAYVLNQMTLEDLKTLDKVVGAIKAAVTKMNRFHVANTTKTVSNLAQGDMLFLESLGEAKISKTSLGRNIKQMLTWGNATPYYAFKRFGDGGKVIYEALMDGWDKFAFLVRQIKDYAENAYTVEDVQRWSEELHEFDILLPASKEELSDPDFEGNHKKIQLTTAQIMSLYCLQKRDQAVGHLLGGGIGIADIKTKDGVITQNFSVMLTETELNKIIDKLRETDEKAVQVAEALQKFMNEDCAEWGNEVSMKRFGYKAFGEESYFPIKSDPRVLKGKKDTPTEHEKSLYRLLNMSFSKSLTEGANNRILVESIFDVFAQHTSEMAKYNALALPALDAVRWFNYTEKGPKKADGQYDTKSVFESMINAFGNDATNYVRTFLEDLNGADNVGRDKLAKGFFSNSKIASVGFNLKVVALQPTSYLRAAAVIDQKYLTKGMGMKPQFELAEKYCGIAQWKSFGFYDTNIQRGVADLIKHDKDWKDKLTEKSMKGAEKADKWTLGHLWNACELEIREKHPSLKGEEFYKAVGKRLRDIIYATQVVDSTMTRSHMMRSSDGFDKMVTSFASEPTLSYNMLQDCYFDVYLSARQSGDWKGAVHKHRGKLLKVYGAYTATNTITALIETAFQAYRDDDDDEEKIIDYIKMYLENFGSNMGITTKIPYIKDLISVIQGFRSNRTDTQWMQNMVYAAKQWMKVFSGEGNAYKATCQTLQSASQVSGVAGSNLFREAVSLWNITIGNLFPSLKISY